MLVNVNKKYAEEKWDILWEGLKTSLPQTDDEYKQRVLSCVRKGSIHVWVFLRGDNIIGALLTTIQTNFIDMCGSLVIFAASSVLQLNAPEYEKGYATLHEFARKVGCVNISFYTNQEKLLRWAKRHKALTETHVVLPLIED